MRARAPGRKPIPNEVKRRRGQKVPKPVAILPAVTVLDPIEPTTDGTDLVNAILDSGGSSWIAPTDRLVLLVLLRDAWDERTRLRADIEANGYGEGRYSRPAVLRLDRLEERITTWLSLLALTPTDRARLGMAEVRAGARLEALRGRRARLAGSRNEGG